MCAVVCDILRVKIIIWCCTHVAAETQTVFRAVDDRMLRRKSRGARKDSRGIMVDTKKLLKKSVTFRIGSRLCNRSTGVRYTLPVSSANKRRCFSMKSPATLRERYKLVGKSTRSSRDKGYARVQIARRSSATVICYYHIIGRYSRIISIRNIIHNNTYIIYLYIIITKHDRFHPFFLCIMHSLFKI